MEQVKTLNDELTFTMTVAPNIRIVNTKFHGVLYSGVIQGDESRNEFRIFKGDTLLGSGQLNCGMIASVKIVRYTIRGMVGVAARKHNRRQNLKARKALETLEEIGEDEKARIKENNPFV